MSNNKLFADNKKQMHKKIEIDKQINQDFGDLSDLSDLSYEEDDDDINPG